MQWLARLAVTCALVATTLNAPAQADILLWHQPNGGSQSVYKSGFDGSGASQFGAGFATIAADDDGSHYYTFDIAVGGGSGGGLGCFRRPVNGGISDLIGTTGGATPISLDHTRDASGVEWLVWNRGGLIERTRVDNWSPQVIASASPDARVCFDETPSAPRVFYTNSGLLRRCALDGSGNAAIVSLGSSVRDITYDENRKVLYASSPAGITCVDSGGGAQSMGVLGGWSITALSAVDELGEFFLVVNSDQIWRCVQWSVFTPVHTASGVIGDLESWSSAPPASNLMLHYSFDNASSVVLDESGLHHLGFVHAAGQEVTQCGKSMTFAGNNNVLELNTPDRPDLDIVGAMTGMAWIKPAGTQSPDGDASCTQGTVFTKGGNYWLQIEHDNDGIGFQNEGSGLDYYTVPTAIPLHQWTHVAFVRQADGKTVRLFKNGVALGGWHTMVNSNGPNDLPLDIGHGSYGQGSTCEFNGAIDEVKIWNRELTPAEIAAEYAAFVRPVSISSHPVGVTQCWASSATLNVTAHGSGALSYQWFRDGAPVLNDGVHSGATTASLLIQSFGASVSSGYHCVVTNACGPLPSNTAQVVLYGGPSITAHPVSAMACPGGAVQFTVTAVGPPQTPNLSYSWLNANGWISNGGAFSGAGTPTLTITNPTAAEAGWYRVFVSNGCANAIGNLIYLTLGAAPVISTQPASTSVCSSSTAQLSVIASAPSTSPITGYSWTHNGNPVGNGGSYSGASTATLTIMNASPALAGVYRCTVTNACGVATSSFATLTVNTSNQGPISVSPGSLTRCPGAPVSLTASGGSGGQFKWYAGTLGGSSVHTGDTYSFNAPLSAGVHTYYVRRESATCPPSPHATVAVTVQPAPLNVDCSTASAMTGTSVNFDTTCASDGASPDCVRRGVWFTFQAPEAGTGHATVAGTWFTPRVAVYSGVCPGYQLVSCADITVDFPMAAGATYTIHVGSGDGSGSDGVLDVTWTPPPPCPPLSAPARVATYTFTGTASGSPWSWKIVSADQTFQELRVDSVPALLIGSTPAQIADAFAASINAEAALSGCSLAQLRAIPNPFGIQGKMTVNFRSAMTSNGLELWVGPAGDPSCRVTTASTGSSCTFLLPSISVEKDDLPEDDCNENALPDVFDILFGVSADVDGNGVPDECAQSVGVALCAGDGVSAPCPCGNNSAPGADEGCRNSLGVGAKLTATGTPSLSNDTLVLRCSGMPNSSALYFQGFAQPALPFGDGLRCAAGPIRRLDVAQNANGGSSYPTAGATAISVKGQIGAPGVVQAYQVWYRDPSSFCTASTVNLSNALEITWLP